MEQDKMKTQETLVINGHKLRAGIKDFGDSAINWIATSDMELSKVGWSADDLAGLFPAYYGGPGRLYSDPPWIRRNDHGRILITQRCGMDI
jgi:hypothetical protein